MNAIFGVIAGFVDIAMIGGILFFTNGFVRI